MWPRFPKYHSEMASHPATARVMPDRSEPGHIGHPSAATAEKGEALFQFFAGGVATYLERVVAWDGKEWDC